MKLPATTWLGDLLGRIGIVVVFTHAAAVKTKLLFGLIKAQQLAGADFLRLLSETANLAFLILIVATTIVRLRPLRAAGGIEPRVTALSGAFALAFMVLLPATIHLPPAMTVFALCLLLTGFSLSAYVLYWLGRSFSVMAEARRLVTVGPYASVRHPLYATEEIAILGILLLNLSLPAMALVSLQWAIQLRRMHHEEQVLRAAFPEYERYAAVTPKVLPRLWAAPLRKPI